MIDPSLFPHLDGFIGCYFHQDWSEDDSDLESVVRRYRRDVTIDKVQETAREIEELLKMSPSSEDLEKLLLSDFGSYYDPRHTESFSEWLRRIQRLLLIN